MKHVLNTAIQLACCCTLLRFSACTSTEHVVANEEATAENDAPATISVAQPRTTSDSASDPVITSLLDGAFSADQVERGRVVFERSCHECHQPEVFTRPGFLSAWSGQTVDALFDQVRRTMPENAPGRLSRKKYADVLSFVFHLNGLPAGKTELPFSSRLLKKIRIETANERGDAS